MLTTNTQQDNKPQAKTCDICQQAIHADERYVDDGGEIVHTDCVRNWFYSNFGREGLS